MGVKLSIAFSALAIMGAALNTGAAPVLSMIANGVATKVSQPLPSREPARFRLDKASGLLVETWINGAGPYIFAIDTGAGVNLISDRLVREARLPVNAIRPTQLGGLTGVKGSTSRAAVINQLALGRSGNPVASRQTALIVTLPVAVDGILDPTTVYAPSGYTIDFPNETIEPFDGSLQGRQAPAGGAIVPWTRRDGGKAPFVRLQDGRVALVDTGSGFGLAVNGRDAIIVGSNHSRANAVVSRDIGGGNISSRRVAPTTVSIGELELRSVPTDVLCGVETNAPVLLGRDALRPFRITFDPRRRLIEFKPPA